MISDFLTTNIPVVVEAGPVVVVIKGGLVPGAPAWVPVVGADAVEGVTEVNTVDDVGVVAGCPVVTAKEKNHRLSTYILTHAYITKNKFEFILNTDVDLSNTNEAEILYM